MLIKRLIYGWLVAVLINTVPAYAQNLKQVWQHAIGGPLNLAPVVAHETVYVVPQGGYLQAYDLHDGGLKWTFQPDTKIWDRGLSIHNDTLLVCMEGGELAALNALTGKQKWRLNLDGINCQRPAHDNNGVAYVSTTFVGPGLANSPLKGAKLFAIDLATGAILWRHTSEGFLLQTVTTYADRVYLGASYVDPEFQSEEGGPAVYQALDASTGELTWTHKSIYGLPKTLYATADRLVYVAYEDFIVGLDGHTGEQVWQRDTENWVSAFIGQQQQVYFGSANTFVHAWDVRKGDIKWRYNVPGQSFEYLLVKPVLHQGVLYFMTQQGNV